MQLKVIGEKAEPWYAEGLQFTCTQCGNCCTGRPGYVWISEQEIGRLAAHLSLSEEEVRQRYCRNVGGQWSLLEKLNGGQYDCIFLREHQEQVSDGRGGATIRTRRTCAIYEVRPLQCRTWPFWHGLLSSEESWNRAARGCPGMNHGRRYDHEQIERLRDAEDWPMEAPGSGAGASETG